jgi:hypothetical protein
MTHFFFFFFFFFFVAVVIDLFVFLDNEWFMGDL